MNPEAIIQKKLDELKSGGAYRHFLEVNKSAQHFPHFYFQDSAGINRSAVNWCSNDYLCMSTREEVIAKLSFVSHRSGTGSGGTRNISGTTPYHKELEKTLADWHGKENALLFNSAYQANVTTLQTLGRQIPNLVFLSDEENHASIIEGIRATGNQKRIFRHNDIGHLETLLKELPDDQPRMIVFESVYSISGTLAPMRGIIDLATQYQALTYVDEVHAAGLYGPNGAGISEREGLNKRLDIINGTLSKAVGVFGGYIASSNLIIDFIRSFGTGFIFTSSLPPAICSAANKSIKLIQENPEWRISFFQNVKRLRELLSCEGIAFTKNESHITRIPVPGAGRCREMATKLLVMQGVYLQPINFPTVPRGEECLRIVITGRHQPKHINHLVMSLNKILYGKNQINRKEFDPFAFTGAASEILH